MLVQLTILIMAENVLAVVVYPAPTRNPVHQALARIRFSTEGNRNSVRNEGWLEAFENFVDLTLSDIWDMAPGFS